MLPVSLSCPFLIAPSVFSNLYLFLFGRRQTQQIKVRENRRSNQEWTTQRNLQHWVHKTPDEEKQNKYKLEKTEGAIKNGQLLDYPFGFL
jgi:hypothetical protein